MKDIIEKEAEDGQQQQEEEDVDLTPREHQRALKGAYRSFVIPGVPKTDIDSYFDQSKPHIKTLIENQLKEMGPAKIIMDAQCRSVSYTLRTQEMLRTWMMALLEITKSGWRCHLTA